MVRSDYSRSHDNPAPVFHPEFGRFMLEATPGKPWGIGFKDLLDVEPNMKWRYVSISKLACGYALTY
jgi:glutamate--cysteine ligase catalytic subunit